MAPYSMDLRTRVLADCDGGLAAKEVAAKFRVSRSWVNRRSSKTSFWMNAASRLICYDATAEAPSAGGSTITRPAVIGRPIR